LLDVEGRIDGLADFAERTQLFDRLGEFPSPRLHLVKQAHVLDRDHGLVGESGDQVDLPLCERLDRRAQEAEDAYRLAVTEQRHSKNRAKIPQAL
jgi:hypothetical protein